MSKCDLAVVLEKPDAQFQPGDTITGFVTVDVNKSVNARAFKVVLVNRTHGRGNIWRKEHQEKVLFEGQWAPGEQHLYPFEFTIPNGPVTYHGNVLNVSWFIYTTVDIPWAFDPEHEHEVFLSAGEHTGLSQGPDTPVIPMDIPEGVVMGLLGVFALFIIAFSFAPLIMFGSDVFTNPAPVIGFSLVWAIPLWCGAAWLIYMAVRNKVAEQKLGEVTVEIEPKSVLPGDEVAVFVTLAGASVTLNGATVTLSGREVVVSGSGTNTTTHTHELHESSSALAGSESIEGDYNLTTTLRVPDDAPASFGAPSNHLNWSIQVVFDIQWWPDWSRTVPIKVRPS